MCVAFLQDLCCFWPQPVCFAVQSDVRMLFAFLPPVRASLSFWIFMYLSSLSFWIFVYLSLLFASACANCTELVDLCVCSLLRFAFALSCCCVYFLALCTCLSFPAVCFCFFCTAVSVCFFASFLALYVCLSISKSFVPLSDLCSRFLRAETTQTKSGAEVSTASGPAGVTVH